MCNRAKPLSLAGSELRGVNHVCALFNSDEEEYRLLLPFIKDGFENGEKAIHVINPHERSEHIDRLASAGIDTMTAEQSGQLELRDNTSTYIRDGRFDPNRMLEVFEQLAGGDSDRAFPFSRIVCRMDWAAECEVDVGDLIEFESRVNNVWAQHDDAVICTYHLSQFRGDAVIDILRTHPFVIVGGVLQKNPFFVPPEQFLLEFRARRATMGGRHAGS